MSIAIPNFLTPKVISSLDTYDYTIVNTATHVASASVTIPPDSALVIVIKKNSTTIATSVAPVPGQPVLNLSASIACAANDVIHFQLTSSQPSDNAPNALKGILNVHIGSSN